MIVTLSIIARMWTKILDATFICDTIDWDIRQYLIRQHELTQRLGFHTSHTRTNTDMNLHRLFASHPNVGHLWVNNILCNVTAKMHAMSKGFQFLVVLCCWCGWIIKMCAIAINFALCQEVVHPYQAEGAQGNSMHPHQIMFLFSSETFVC